MRYLSSLVFVLCVYVNPGERGDPGASELHLLGSVCVCYIHRCTYYVFSLPQVEGETPEQVSCICWAVFVCVTFIGVHIMCSRYPR